MEALIMSGSSNELNSDLQDNRSQSITKNIQSDSSEYYQVVADYYDTDATDFERRYSRNPILQKIRTDFRNITEQFSFKSILEIGIGPGLDLLYFAKKFPNIPIYGIDVSPDMVKKAIETINAAKVPNVKVDIGTPEQLSELYSNLTFDLIYSYFGALNTVPNLQNVVQNFQEIISQSGTLVLTFVNRFYLIDILWNLFKLNPKQAFARIKNNWHGYSTAKYLPSTCRSAREIKAHFEPHFEIIWRKGYSILFPAWYRANYIPINGLIGKTLWAVDQLLNRTPFWNLGEYTLYIMKPL